MEQIRLIKEMREHDRNTGRTGEFVRPRYMVWENVVGAMSSNKGLDFAAVLEEAIRIAEPKANRQGYSGEAVCVEPDDFCSYGLRKGGNDNVSG